MTAERPAPLPAEWPVPRASRQLSTDWIVLAPSGPLTIHHPRALALLDPSLIVLVPWVGQWSTRTFQSTVAELLQRVQDNVL